MSHYRLILEADDWDDIFYKDEGGRDKCMVVTVKLLDDHGMQVFDRQVPLALTLCYDNEYDQEVMKQENLRILGPPKQFIEEGTGSATLRFRVEDVSKNHQGQNFKVKVQALEPSKYPGIAPVFTPAVSVRSKRNKRGRSGGGLDSTSPGRRSMLAGALIPPHRAIPIHEIQTHPQKMTYKSSPAVDDDIEGFRGISDVHRLREAMRGIIQWTEEVVNGLHPLQWQVIGYAQYPDGTLDYNHPYHSMPNPNNCITKILQMYSDSTRDDFRMLLKAVENTVHCESISHAERTSSRRDHLVGVQQLQKDTLDTVGVPQQLEQRNVDERIHTPEHSPSLVSRSFGSGGSSSTHHDYLLGALNKRGRSDGDELQVLDTTSTPETTVVGQQMTPVITNIDHGETSVANSAMRGDEPFRDDVKFVLAKQYKSIKTGERLGFPAFNSNMDMLGFYTETVPKCGIDKFVHIMYLSDEFGLLERSQAKDIISHAISTNNPAVHALQQWGSLKNLLDHVVVFDWAKGMMNKDNERHQPTEDGADTIHFKSNTSGMLESTTMKSEI